MLTSSFRPAEKDGARPQRRQQLRVGFLLIDKFTLNAFAGFIDALRLAADEGARSRQILCGWEVMGTEPVAASCGVVIKPGNAPDMLQRFDYIAVCGGNGYTRRQQPKWLDRCLKQADAAGVKLIGVCTGTFNIARAGLMHGYTACIHWNMLQAFQEEFPEIDARPDRIFIDAGRRITCAGSAGTTDMALHLIARHCGSERASQSMRHMMLADARPAEFPQAHFHSVLSGVRDAGVRRAVLLMEQRLNQPTLMADIAASCGLSLRQLERRFMRDFAMTPVAYSRDLRLRYGAFLLEHTTGSITDIAVATGFADGAHFSRTFRAKYSLSPRRYRQNQRSGQRAMGAVAINHGLNRPEFAEGSSS